MKRDEIIRMAREAGIIDRSPFLGVRPAMMDALGNFFALAYEEGAKAEREQCAKVCEGMNMPHDPVPPDIGVVIQKLIDAGYIDTVLAELAKRRAQHKYMPANEETAKLMERLKEGNKCEPQS